MFDQNRAADGDDAELDAALNWLVLDQLSCVLHMGDSRSAYRLSAQGHEVTVAGDDVRHIRDQHMSYVRTTGDRLPFLSNSFDAVLVPHLDESTTALSEYARVLRPGGVIATQVHAHDESIPWVRKLREIVGGPRHGTLGSVEAFAASGLFHPLESTELISWQQLDAHALVQFARETGAVGISDSDIERVRALYDDYATHAGFLRIRRVVHNVRARVDKESVPDDEPVADTILFSLS